MRGWFKAGHFPPTTRVKCISRGETDFVAIKDRSYTPFTGAAAADTSASLSAALAAAITAATGSGSGGGGSGGGSGGAATAIAAAAADPKWYYLDDMKQPRGPYTTLQMRSWYLEGFLDDPFLKVKREDESDSAYELIKRRPCAFVPNQDLSAIAVVNDTHTANDIVSVAAAIERERGERWYYLDLAGQLQGPWTTQQMRGWFTGGFLKEDVRVRLIGEDDFIPLGKRVGCSFMRPAPQMPAPPVQAYSLAPTPALSVLQPVLQPALQHALLTQLQQPQVPNWAASPQPAVQQYLQQMQYRQSLSAAAGALAAQANPYAAAAASAVALNPYATASYDMGSIGSIGSIGTPYDTNGVASGTFNARTGKFEGAGRRTAREVGTAERQMGHYFDHGMCVQHQIHPQRIN